jgi:hypothetical protein
MQVDLTSPPDREELCASLMADLVEFAEVRREGGGFVVEIYARPDGGPWSFPVTEVTEALAKAISRLSDRVTFPHAD